MNGSTPEDGVEEREEDGDRAGRPWEEHGEARHVAGPCGPDGGFVRFVIDDRFRREFELAKAAQAQAKAAYQRGKTAGRKRRRRKGR